MSAAYQLLLIGSLPPTRSHAALMTHAIALAATECGIDVVCLIDALAPPPKALPYRVVRSFDEFIQSGSANSWPRLFVVGSKGDSLQAIEALHAAPGAVIVAAQSLFDLALPWLQTSAAYPDNFVSWLTTRFGEAGSSIADGLTLHRRQAKELTSEIPAYDLLLAPATTHLALEPLQSLSLGHAGFTPKEITGPPPPKALKLANQKHRNSPLRIAIVGARSAVKSAVKNVGNSNKIMSKQQVAFYDRYDPNTGAEILAADAVAILDGHDAVWCPHFDLALACGIPLVTANQRWAANLSGDAQICIENPVSQTAVIHAIVALATVDGLLAGLKDGLKQHQPEAQNFDGWSAAIQTAAATARPAALDKINTSLPIIEATASAEKLGTNIQAASGIMALVGAAPAGPLLKQFFPDLDAEKCPRFMTTEIASALSAFVGKPAPQMQDQMGFEAPLIADGTHDTSTQASARKIRRWADVQPGLRLAKKALAFGCAIDGAIAASLAGQKIRWPFKIPPEIFGNPAITSAYDSGSGIYWSHDPVRGSLTCALFTGGEGALRFTAAGENSFVITDLSSTSIASQTASCAFKTASHGVCLFKLSVLPALENNDEYLMKILAQDGLLLEWSVRE